MATYIAVHVPEDRLADVYRLLGSPSGGVAVEDQPLAPEPDPEFWRDPDNIREHLIPRSETIRELAKYLASRPDEEVTAHEAADHLELPHGWNSLAGALGAFGRYCANRDLGFPWATNYGDDWRVRLTLDAATAEVFRRYL